MKPSLPPVFSILICLMHEPRYGPFRKVEGYSGSVYVFTWDDIRNCYTFTPKSQEESDDLFKTVGRVGSSLFRPIFIVADREEAPLPATEPIPSAISDACVQAGIIFTEDDDVGILKRLLEVREKTYAAGFAAGEQAAAERFTPRKKHSSQA